MGVPHSFFGMDSGVQSSNMSVSTNSNNAFNPNAMMAVNNNLRISDYNVNSNMDQLQQLHAPQLQFNTGTCTSAPDNHNNNYSTTMQPICAVNGNGNGNNQCMNVVNNASSSSMNTTPS